jgi:hypothetical protein
MDRMGRDSMGMVPIHDASVMHDPNYYFKLA